jgi:signal transduction histidine kinase
MDSGEASDLVSSAVSTLPINFAILDDEGTIRHTNRAWREFGRVNDIDMRPETIGANYLEITAQAETEAARTAAEGIAELLAGERELFEFEYPCHSPDEQRWFLMRAAAFLDDGQRYVAIAHFDITERYEYQRRLEASNEHLDQFADAVSHDLREPLRMVTSYLELLEERCGDDLDADAEEFLEFAVDGAERMQAMIEGLLAYSRAETRSEPFASVDLEAVLADVLADLDLRIEETDTEITAESLPTVRGDASQLRRLFQNLLDNAVEYSGEAPPRVTITATRAGEKWEVSISDEGIGIDPAKTDQVFGVFERLHGQADHEGTGIGLALCRRIVERHGGEIWIEDDDHHDGATFSFTLPAATDRAT